MAAMKRRSDGRTKERSAPAPIVLVIDDDEYRGVADDIKEIAPNATVHHYQDIMGAWKHSGRVDAACIDVSAICHMVEGPEHAYWPICSFIEKHPGAAIIINSAVSSRFTDYLRELIVERIPDSVIRVVDWSTCRPDESLKAILRELLISSSVTSV